MGWFGRDEGDEVSCARTRDRESLPEAPEIGCCEGVGVAVGIGIGVGWLGLVGSEAMKSGVHELERVNLCGLPPPYCPRVGVEVRVEGWGGSWTSGWGGFSGGV